MSNSSKGPVATEEPPPVIAGKRRRNVVAGAVIVIALLLAGGVFTYLGPIFKPLLVGIFLMFALRAAVEVFTRVGLSRFLAFILLFILAVAITALLSLFAYSEALGFQDDWPRYQRRVLALTDQAPAGTEEALRKMLNESSREIYSYVLETSVGTLELLTMAFFYLLFLMLGAKHLPGRVRRALPAERADSILTIGRRIGKGMEQFMKVKTLVSAGMGLTAAAIMWGFSLDHWLLWGLVFFAFNYITYIGSMAACVPPIVIAFLDLDSPIAATVLAVLIVVNRFIWIDYIEIKMSGKHLNVDSVLLFVWLAYWGWAWGVLGLILAFPMITSLKIILESLPSTQSWAVLMGED
jgi:predicted PurR-regulated permease PerM